MVDDRGGALRLRGDAFELAGEVIGVAVAFREVLGADVGGHPDDVEGLVDLVRHAGGHLAESGKLRRLDELGLGALALGGIAQHADEHGAVAHLRAAQGDLERHHGAVFAPPGDLVRADPDDLAIARG